MTSAGPSPRYMKTSGGRGRAIALGGAEQRAATAECRRADLWRTISDSYTLIPGPRGTTAADIFQGIHEDRIRS